MPDVRADLRSGAEADPDIVFGSINTEQERTCPVAWISSIPTLMVFRDGIMVFRQPGALPASALDQVIEAVRLDMATYAARSPSSRSRACSRPGYPATTAHRH